MSDTSGVATFEFGADDAPIVSVEYPGYAKSIQPLDWSGAEVVGTTIALVGIQSQVIANVTEGVVVDLATPGGGSLGTLDIPKGGLVNAAGDTVTGEVEIASAYVAPEDAVPGKTPVPMSVPEDDGTMTPLISHGMIDVTITKDDEEVSVKEGETLALALPAKEDEPESVPMWSFDEEKGIWVQEGTATRDGDEWKLDLPHLSWWNVDRKYPATAATGCCLTLEAQTPAGGVAASRDIYFALTDDQGKDAGYILNTTDSAGMITVSGLWCDQKVGVWEYWHAGGAKMQALFGDVTPTKPDCTTATVKVACLGDAQCAAGQKCEAGKCTSGCPDADSDGVCDSADKCPAGDDAVDTDSDGLADACDPCPGDAEVGQFNWVTWDAPISGKTATGTVGKTSITYTSTEDLSTTPSVYGYGKFPASYKVPNANPTIRNVKKTTNTLTFAHAVEDPLLVFASVGRAGAQVPVFFDQPIEVVWKDAGITGVNANGFTGEEGNVIVRVAGTHSHVKFDYLAAEFYANFVFGFTATSADNNGNGTPDACEVCAASCEGKVCGDDGCGGTCGACDASAICSTSGTVCQPEGDTCQNPLVVGPAVPATAQGSTVDFNPNYGYSEGVCPGEEGSWGGGDEAGSNDVVYSFTPAKTGNYTIQLTPEAAFDSNLYVVTDCGNIDGTCLGGHEEIGNGVVETVFTELTANTTYYIIVDGWSPDSNTTGAFTLTITLEEGCDCGDKVCGDDGCGGSCGTCDDSKGCTVDTCDVGTCKFKEACSQGTVLWNDLTGFTSAVTTWPYDVPLKTPKPTTVKVSRSNAFSISPFNSPAAEGSFTNAKIPGLTFSWSGGFKYININTPGNGTPNAGTVTFDFQKAATTNGSGYYYIFGITALAFANQGPLKVQSSVPLQYIGAVNAWGAGSQATTYDPETQTITGPAGGTNTAMEFFLMPQEASQIVLTLTDTGPAADTFGFWVGAVDIGQKCSDPGAAGMCMAAGGTCGDGIKAAAEACDDGNTDPDDGCSATCTVEAGFTCDTDVLTTSCKKACGGFGEPCCAAGPQCSGTWTCDAKNTCACATGFECGSGCCPFGQACKSGTCEAAPTCDETIFAPGGTALNAGCETNAAAPCPATCLVAKKAGATTSGVYLIKPKAGEAAFKVQCDMELDGGGWTLVGFEPASSPATTTPGKAQTGVMAYLWQENVSSVDGLAGGSAAGFIGPRFTHGTDYGSARFTWCTAGNKFVFQKFETSGELFADAAAVDAASNAASTKKVITLSNFTTNDSALNALLKDPNDAAFCRAATSTGKPGDTSWAVKQKDEPSTACGCNSGGWVGTGSYYGGTAASCSACTCWGGGWAGTAANSVPKGGVNTNKFYFWIR